MNWSERERKQGMEAKVNDVNVAILLEEEKVMKRLGMKVRGS